MPDPIARIAAIILAGVFVWAGLAKILRPLAWREALEAYRLPRPARLLAAGLIPLLELAVPFGILSGNSRPGAALAIGVVAGGSLMVLRARSLHGDEVPCGCFGGGNARDYRTLLTRNALIGLDAAVVALSPERLASRNDLFSNIEVVPVVLILAGAGAIWGLALAGESMGRWRR